MAYKILPDQEVLLQLLRYDAESGKLYWRERGTEWFPESGWGQEYSARAWNARQADKEAFTAKNVNGYLHGALLGQTVAAHRVVWKMANGTDAVGDIDHINGGRADNRIANLRDVDAATNRRNAAQSVRNTSGVTGVTFFRKTGQWRATITVDRRTYSLGYHDTIEGAARARKSAEKRFQFHENHGRKNAN